MKITPLKLIMWIYLFFFIMLELIILFIDKSFSFQAIYFLLPIILLSFAFYIFNAVMIARYAIDPGTQRTVLFGQLDHVFEHADTCGSGARSEPNIAAKNLAELPLVDNIMVLKFAPGKVKLKG